jgi:hypothetical protein
MFAAWFVHQDPPAPGVNGTYNVSSLPYASCVLHNGYPSGNPLEHHRTLTVGPDGHTGNLPWGGTWVAGTYNLTAVCTLSGYPPKTTPIYIATMLGP